MKRLNSKIILFGEYSLLAGSSALTIPFEKFNGFFTSSKELIGDSLESNVVLRKLSAYLKIQSKNVLSVIDLDSLNNDLENGLYFKTDIPDGYGLGSSGAVVAAIFHKYSNTELKITDQITLSLLRKDMGLAESFFHGTSSGIDPLSIYTSSPLLFNKNSINLMDLEESGKLLSNFYLYDTGLKNTTSALVGSFINKMEGHSFKSKIENVLIPSVNSCIQSLLECNNVSLKSGLKTLSDFQFTHFKEAIPVHIQELWQQGLKTGEFYFKLCGSGGGGYMLVYSELKKDLLEEKIQSGLLHI
jgi:mevalonate kinase